jgi:hypothetical protein
MIAKSATATEEAPATDQFVDSWDDDDAHREVEIDDGREQTKPIRVKRDSEGASDDLDTIKLYLKEIRKSSLLTFAEEQALAKRVQEGLIETSGIPYTVLRATQFFEFLKSIADGGTRGNVVHVSPSKFQPVAADDVAATLAEIAVARPKNGVVELAGPEASGMAAFIQSFLSSIGDERNVIPDPDAKYFGAVLDKNGLAPTGQFIAGPTRFADWARSSS